ncbi:hypothetical protein EJ110_NYTH53203 [Nymphaea thermarum]|nr:hypothetical protein EJ110_NYTH53203 [Nymphaea thermarum]
MDSCVLNVQGCSTYSVGRKYNEKRLFTSSFKQFIHLNDRQHLFQKSLLPSTPKHSSVTVFAKADRQSWDFGRFLKTLYFFNGPPSPAKFFEFIVEKLSSSTTSEPIKKMENNEVILVAGATGGVGKRVVDILRKKGLPVRILVRNAEKARAMFGSDVDVIVGDITKAETLSPEYFKSVKKVINAVSVIVGPKEGDTPDRAKYNQGIRFFEPEIKGDSPEKVEYDGMRNLINAVKHGVGYRNGKLIFGFEDGMSGGLAWGALDDVVMGGVSESTFLINPNGGELGGATGIFKGLMCFHCQQWWIYKYQDKGKHFTSYFYLMSMFLLCSNMWSLWNFPVPLDLSAYDGLELRLKGDGCRYKLILRTSSEWDTVGYTASFDTVNGEWQNVQVQFASLRPIFRARTIKDAPPFDPSRLISLQLMYSKFEYDGKLNPTFKEGEFQLPITSIRAYIQDPVKPRFVHVSSAGVTRPERPGLDLTKQPPAVRLNKELGYILTFKLKGEDLIRESGVPYTIIRPCALTEEPAGADLIFDQGDNITVKSVVPFSEPFTVDANNPPAEKDYEVYFKNLKEGITGKEDLEAPVTA